MKEILIFIPNPFSAKNIIHSGVLKSVLKHKDIQVTMLVPYFKYQYYQNLYKDNERVSVAAVPPKGMVNKIDYIYQSIIQASLPTRTVRIKHYTKLVCSPVRRLPRSILIFILNRACWWLGKLSLWKKVYGCLYRALAQRTFKELFDKTSFDLVFLPTLLNSVDQRLIFEARRRNITVIGSILSWDNLTAKLLLPFLPDKVAVPSKIVADELIRYDGARRDVIDVIGYPQYDRYFNREDLLSREEFCKKVGLDPARPYVLYAMAGRNNMPTDPIILRGIQEAINNGSLRKDLQVLIRPYPKYVRDSKEEATFSKNPNFVFDSGEVHMVDGKHWELEVSSVSHLANSIYHSALVTSVMSTILLEAVTMGRPMINIAFSGLASESTLGVGYYKSQVRRTDFNHVRKLIEKGIFVSAYDKDSFLLLIKSYLDDPSADQDKFNRLRDIVCEYTDGRSAERMTHFILEALSLK